MESKQTRALIFLVASAAALILLSGCTLSVPNSDKLSQADWTVTQYTPPGDLQCKPLPGAFPCYCMICKNHTNWAATLANYLHPWFDGSLKAGECNFDECTPTTFQETITDPAKMKTTQGRALMFGMGPSFYSTDNADLYCKYTLQLATKWMVGKSGPPKVPAAYRAECWLDRNVMPVYIYYTAGQYIDPARTGEIAAELDGVGPALVTTEVDLDSSDPSQIADVKAQLDALQSCAKCKKVLAVHSGDMFALEQILGPPGTPSSYYNKVDLVGFGFRANDYLKCDVTSIIGQNYLFSRDILNKYNKPTIWLYAGASEGKNVDGSCEWSPQMVHDFYQGIYSTSIGMASSGIIGSSFYEFVDGTGPLPCTPDEGCRFGVMKADGTQKHPEINTWSDLCRQYGSQDFRNPLIFSKNGQGAVCDVANSAQIHAGISTEINSNVPLSTVDVVPMDRQAKLGCGEVCVSESKMKEPDIYDNTGGSIAQAHCAEYPIIDELADDADFSSLYYRAVVEQESGFDPLIASCVDNSNNNCNVAGESLSKICSDAGMAGCHTTSGAADCPSGQKPCAFGLAQCIEFPGDPVYTAKCGGGQPYNPFDPGMSVCCGISKMRTNLDKSEEWVNNNWAQLSKCTDGMKDDERGWASYYLASLNYFGLGYNSKLNDFISQRDNGGECNGGKQNFIAYLRTLSTSSPPGYDYSAQIMSKYVNSVSICDSDCPGK